MIEEGWAVVAKDDTGFEQITLSSTGQQFELYADQKRAKQRIEYADVAGDFRGYTLITKKVKIIFD